MEDEYGKYRDYKEMDDKVLMDSLYVSKDAIENFNNYTVFKTLDEIEANKRQIPDEVCGIDNEYRCKNIIEDFDNLKNTLTNKINDNEEKYNDKMKIRENEINKLQDKVKLYKTILIIISLIIIFIIILFLFIIYKIFDIRWEINNHKQ